MEKTSIGFIGGGRITKIFFRRLLKDEKYSDFCVSDCNEELLSFYKSSNVETTTENNIPAKRDIIFIALHPPVFMQVLEEIKNTISEKTILISLAPKITIEKMSNHLNGHKKIVRSIPNSPTMIGLGYNPLSFSKNFPSDEKNIVFELFENFGKWFEAEENKLEAYALITAMGPTYFQFQYKKLFELAKSFGMNEREAREGIFHMLIGTANLMLNSEFNYDQVNDLIPVKPLEDDHEKIENIFNNKLLPLFNKLKN